jgi:uncharacterized DUF497 family protein
MSLMFEWDNTKAEINYKKHRVRFEEAKTVFNDPNLLTFPDPYHFINKQRYLNIGISDHGRVFVVLHTEREGYIRLISSRKATVAERRAYETRET